MATGFVSAVQLDLVHSEMEARITGVQAGLTHTEMTARVTASQIDLTYSRMTGRVAAMQVRTTETLTGTTMPALGARVMAVQAVVTRPIHHHMEYDALGLGVEVEYDAPAPEEYAYDAPLDDLILDAKESPPRGGKDPGIEE